jgi:hypothetical protein
VLPDARAGINPKIVSTRLGHASVAFTLEVYTADVPELDCDAADQISGLFLPPIQRPARTGAPAQRPGRHTAWRST